MPRLNQGQGEHYITTLQASLSQRLFSHLVKQSEQMPQMSQDCTKSLNVCYFLIYNKIIQLQSLSKKMILPEINRLSGEDLKKIFPAHYYKKYARYSNVVEFENDALNNNQDNHTMKELKKKVYPTSVSVQKRKDFFPLFEAASSIIKFNKQQVSRMSRFTKALAAKLESGPAKKDDTIKPPIKQKVEADQNILGRLKAIEDLEFQRILKQKQDKKRYLQRKQMCKFVRKCKSTKISPRNSRNFSRLFENPEDNLNSSKIYQRSSSKGNRKSLGNINSQLFQSKRLQRQSKSQMLLQNEGLLRKDYVEQTKKVKKYVTSMETISYYNSEVQKKKHHELLSIL